MKNVFVLVIGLFLFAGCRQQEGPALIPADRLDKPWWKARHEQVLQQIRQKDPALILIGNSILHHLDDSVNEGVRERYLDRYRTVNMGFSGDRTENVIWRLEHGEIDGIRPGVALLLIGTNNLDGNHYPSITPPHELAAAIGKICHIIHEKLPETKILLLAILPYGYNQPNYRNTLIDETNRILAKEVAKEPMVEYLNVGELFLTPEGRVDKMLMPDYLHPDTRGYMKLFGRLEKEIDRLMQ